MSVYWLMVLFDVRLLKYKIAYESATSESSKKFLAKRIQELVDQSNDKYAQIKSDRPIDYYHIYDITDKLNDFMAAEEDKYNFIYNESMVIKLYLFYTLVRNGAIYDLKNQPDWQHEHFIYNGEIIDKDAPGNINYGYLGKVFGFPDIILYAGAGYAQLKSGNSDIKFIFSWFDDPRDQDRIKQGINIYKKSHSGFLGIYWGK